MYYFGLHISVLLLLMIILISAFEFSLFYGTRKSFMLSINLDNDINFEAILDDIKQASTSVKIIVSVAMSINAIMMFLFVVSIIIGVLQLCPQAMICAILFWYIFKESSD